MHAPLFGALSIALMMILERVRPLRNDFSEIAIRGGLVILVMSTFGAAMELVQGGFGRSASTHDALANTLGVSGAVFGCVGWRWHRARPSRKSLSSVLLLAAGCLFALAWYRPVMILRDVMNVERRFPELATFESPAELGRFWFHECRGVRKKQDPTDGRYVLQVDYEKSAYPRFALVQLHRDWSNAQALEFDVRMIAPKQGTVTFQVKVVDDSDNESNDKGAYRGRWTLQPGNTERIRITREELLKGPKDRSLDLSDIDYVDFGLVRPDTATQIQIDRIRVVE